MRELVITSYSHLLSWELCKGPNVFSIRVGRLGEKEAGLMKTHSLKKKTLRQHTIYVLQTSISFSSQLFVNTRISVFIRKQRPVSTPVQRIILDPVMEQTIIEGADSPRTTISERIKVMCSTLRLIFY